MMLKILHLSQNKTKIFNELVDERLEKITDSDKKKVNTDDLIYRYKGDVKFNEFDNALDINDKMRDGKIDLANVKNYQEKPKFYLGEIKKKETKSKDQNSKKTLCIILKCFTMQETKLLNFMMIILQ